MPISPRSPLHLPYISPISPPSSTFDIICDEPAPISPFHLPYISHISPPSSTFEIICDEPEAREHLAGIQRWKERHATKPDPCYYLTDEAGAAVQQNDDQLELWCAAAWVRPRVTAMMKRFAIPRHPGRGLKEHVAIKKHVRIAEKVMLRPGEMQRNANRVLDLVRDMYAAETIKEVAGVVDAMCRWEAIQVVRIKDRSHCRLLSVTVCYQVGGDPGGADQGPLRRALRRRLARLHDQLCDEGRPTPAYLRAADHARQDGDAARDAQGARGVRPHAQRRRAARVPRGRRVRRWEKVGKSGRRCEKV